VTVVGEFSAGGAPSGNNGNVLDLRFRDDAYFITSGQGRVTDAPSVIQSGGEM